MQTITVSKDTRVYKEGRRGSFLIATGAVLREGSIITVVKSGYRLYNEKPKEAVAYVCGDGSHQWILCEESGIPFPV
jgi:hypothetical protein